jgi:hypothetical protein
MEYGYSEYSAIKALLFECNAWFNTLEDYERFMKGLVEILKI